MFGERSARVVGPPTTLLATPRGVDERATSRPTTSGWTTGSIQFPGIESKENLLSSVATVFSFPAAAPA
jgi:hypothetical protein